MLQLQSGLAGSGSLGPGGHERFKPKRIDYDRSKRSFDASGNDYWATQVGILVREVMAWSAQANNKSKQAAAMLREAADEEDAIEKLPVTPGPIVPAREQLGYLLLEQNQPALASKEFATALANAPGRRGALGGAARAAELARNGSR